MPGDGLDELDVGARSDEARHTGMPQVVEAVALFGDTGEPERRVPDALPEVRRLERRPANRGEDELLGRVAAALDRPGGQFRNAASTDGNSGTERTPESVSRRKPKSSSKLLGAATARPRKWSSPTKSRRR